MIDSVYSVIAVEEFNCFESKYATIQFLGMLRNAVNWDKLACDFSYDGTVLRIQHVCLCLTCSCVDSGVKLFLGFNFLLFIVFERYWTQAFANNGVLAFFPGFSIRQFG